jgi:glucokinase
MIGVDFGGTQIKAGVVDAGRVVRSNVTATGAGAGPANVLDAIAAAVLELEAQPRSVGLAIPGEVDAVGKVWRLPNVPGFEGVNIAAELTRRLRGAQVAVENDATAAALGERIYGHGREYDSFLLITLGTGIGAGLVISRQLYRGKNGFAGEFGHAMIDQSAAAWPCACGLTGCVEAYSGTRALFRKYAELGGSEQTVLGISERARAGDAAAQETFRFMGRALGLGIAAVQNVLDLDAIVFSGGISASFDLIEPGVREALRERAFAPPLAEVPLVVSTLGEFAGLIGAAHLTEVSGSTT